MNSPASATPPRFDSNRAWQDASAAVAANRDVLAALAGVFVVLPTFALTVLLPMPEPQAGADLDAILKGTQAYFAEFWPWYLLAGLINIVGTMALLALFGQTSRPTVGEAIRTGLAAAPSGIGVQVLQGFLLFGVVLAPATILGLSGSPGLVALGALTGIGIAAWLWARTSLASPAIIVQGVRNPITALQRSFALTKGNAGRLLLFFFLLVLAFVIVTQLSAVVVGLIAQALAGADASTLISALVASVLQGTMSVYLAGAVTISHRQLTGTGRPDVPGVFG
ncbi:MAG: hypothetical protein ABL912_09375 [Novosphingobium sp.]